MVTTFRLSNGLRGMCPVSEPTKPGYNVKTPPVSSKSLDKMQSKGLQNCFGAPWTASYPGSLGKRWSLGPRLVKNIVKIRDTTSGK